MLWWTWERQTSRSLQFRVGKKKIERHEQFIRSINIIWLKAKQTYKKLTRTGDEKTEQSSMDNKFRLRDWGSHLNESKIKRVLDKENGGKTQVDWFIWTREGGSKGRLTTLVKGHAWF